MLNYFVALASFVTQRLSRDERGATAVEYGMIVALIAAIIIGAVATLGGLVNGAFNSVIQNW